MSAYAVIESGGKQYRVTEGDIVELEKLEADEGDVITFDNVLASSSGDALSLGTGTVTGEVIAQKRGPKLLSFKKKRRKGYKRRVGHRQSLTQVKITGLS